MVEEILLAQRSREFDDPPVAPPPGNSQPVPAFPQDAGPDYIRPDFGGNDNPPPTINNSRRTRLQCNEPADVHTYYINGVAVEESGYTASERLIENLLTRAQVPHPVLRRRTYNPTGPSWWHLGDWLESVGQGTHLVTLTDDGQKLINTIINDITSLEEGYDVMNQKNECDCKLKRPKYLLIGHSQGNFFVEDVADELPEKVRKRTVILSLASFTDYRSTNVRGRVQGFDYLLRPDDFPKRVEWLPGIKAPGEPNLPPLTATQEPLTFDTALDEVDRKELGDAKTAHSLANYLGNPTSEEHRFAAEMSLNLAVGKVQELLNFDSGEYEKENCSQTAEQPAQRQQPAQAETPKICQVPDRFWQTHTRVIGPVNLEEHACIVPGAVMTSQGMVDGNEFCAVCYRTGNNTFGQPPDRALCSQPEDPARRNPVPNCPDNWAG
jgi:hypothetical protein